MALSDRQREAIAKDLGSTVDKVFGKGDKLAAKYLTTIGGMIAGGGTAKAVQKYGPLVVREVKKHIKDLKTPRTAGQAQVRQGTRGQRAAREIRREDIVAGAGVAGAAYLAGKGSDKKEDKKTTGKGTYGDDRSGKSLKQLIDAKSSGTMQEYKGPPTSVAEAKRRGMDYYIGKDGKKKKAVYAEDVKPKAKPKEKPKAKSKVLSSTDASTSRSYNKGGYVNCGASVPGTHKRG